MIQPVPHIAKMSAYALAELKAPQGKRIISLSQNESLRPPSPIAIEAAKIAFSDAQLYPDPDWRRLRSALSELHAIPRESILCGNGSMELIASLAETYADANRAVLAPEHAYPFFRTVSQRVRARFDIAPEQSGCVSVDALLASVRPDTKLVFLANPGNPTGTRIPRAEIVRLRDELRGDILLVIDEAYGEFADHLEPSVFDLVERGNTVVLRSFSKAYGLAGVRVGWGLFPLTIVSDMRKVSNPNSISCAGQAAACAALEDQAYMRATCERTATLRDGLIERLRRAGFKVSDSFTNFALIRLANAQDAMMLDGALRAEGVFLRPQSGAGLPECLRITVAESDLLDIAAGFLEALADRRTH